MNFKELSFWVIGIATLVYCLVELGFGLAQHSLTLLSDGFHNLSDVISLYIAYWSSKASRRGRSDIMSYGWKRTEILGALTNGIFLVSLSVYITLETIPEIIEPEAPPSGGIVIIIAFFGLLINTVATVVFHFTGQSHGHSHAGGGHGHSHGGGDDHGHAHDEDDHGHSHAKKKKDEQFSLVEDYHFEEKKKEKKEGHGHSHGGDDHGHSHAEKKEEHGHSHADKEGHAHSHGEKKEKKEGHGHSHGEGEEHGHSHAEKKKEGHGHSHGGDDHGHSHADKKKEDHGHAHGEPKKRKVVDANVKAVCLHYFGDMVSSFFVLVMGIIIYFVPAGATWVDYVDPITSLFIVVLILVTTLPLIKGCFLILLQRTPQHIDLQKLKIKILRLIGVLNVHDFHVWQLVDGMIITSLHITVEESIDFNHLSRKIKKLLHKAGIHSSAIQPEFVNAHHQDSSSCLQNCVKDCAEDWCCKEELPKGKDSKKTPLISSSGPNAKITYSQIEPL